MTSEEIFEKYEDDNDAIGAFSYLFSMIEELLKEVDFEKLKNVCKGRCVKVSREFKCQIQSARDAEDIINTLDENSLYCNWLNTRFLRRICRNCGISKAETLINNFEKHFYSKKVAEMTKHIGQQYFNPDHLSSVTAKISKNHTLTVAEMIEFYQSLEHQLGLPVGSMTPIKYDKGCLEITCVVPVHYSLYLFEVALSQAFRFRAFHIQYLHIDSFPKIYTFKGAQCFCPSTSIGNREW